MSLETSAASLGPASRSMGGARAGPGFSFGLAGAL